MHFCSKTVARSHFPDFSINSKITKWILFTDESIALSGKALQILLLDFCQIFFFWYQILMRYLPVKKEMKTIRIRPFVLYKRGIFWGVFLRFLAFFMVIHAERVRSLWLQKEILKQLECICMCYFSLPFSEVHHHYHSL